MSRFRVLIPWALFVGLLASGWSFRAPLLHGIAALWALSDDYTRADAVVVLGGSPETRPFAAAALYKQGLAGKILIPNVQLSAVERLRILPRHGDLHRQILLRLGVQPAAIMTYGQSVSNTYEEARAVGESARQNGLRSVIVVTEAFSSRRVRWLFKRELGASGVQVGIKVLPPLGYSLDDWWTREHGVIQFQNEVIKYLYNRIKY